MFMGTEIDRLEIEVETFASKANTELDKLISRLDRISGSLSKIDTKKLSRFADGMGQTANVTNKETGSTKKLSDAFAQLTGRISRSNRPLKSFSQLSGKFYANSFLLIRGLKKLGNAIKTSMNYVETYNYFSVTMDKIGKEFGDMYSQYGYDSAESYADSFSGRMNELTRKMTDYNVGSNGELFMSESAGLGLDPQAIQNYQASIAAITNSVGLLGENSVNVSKALTMLSADMSSLKNVDLQTAMTNFQSGLIGQSRALYKYGIDITNNTLQTYAYSMRLNKAVSEMTQAEKMQLRMIAILDQSRVAWGDQANTINSVANQYRIMKQQISNLARVIGNLFLPIVQKVLPVVNGLIIALQRLFNALGFKLWGGNWLKDTMDGISGGGGSNDALGDLADSADNTADGLNDAGKAAEKLRTMVRGIDELNIISPDNTSDSGSGTRTETGEIDLSGAIGDALAEYESIWDKAMANSKNKAQEFADTICGIFNRMWEAIEPFRKALKQLWDEGFSLLMGYTFQNLKDFYTEFLVPLGNWAFGTEDSGFTRLINIINERLMQIDWVWISDNLRKFWRAIEPFAEQFGEGLIDFFEDISKIPVGIVNSLFGRDGAITSLTDWLNNNDPEKARKWGYAFGVLAVGLMALKPATALIDGISKIAGTITSVATAIGILKAGGLLEATGILSKLANIFALVSGGAGTLGEAFSVYFPSITAFASKISTLITALSPATVAFTALAAGIAYVFATNEEVRKSFANLFETLVNSLQPVLLAITNDILPLLSEALSNFWNNVLMPLGQLVGDVLAPLLMIISEALTMLCENIILPLAEALGSILTAAFELVIEVFNRGAEVIGAIVDVLQFMWNKVLEPIASYLWDSFKPVFETVFKAIGGIIDGLSLALTGLIKFVTGVFSGDWEEAWNGVKDIFKGIFNGLVSIAEGVINLIIKGINKFLEGFNGIVTAVGDIVGIDIEIPVIHEVNLPRFANGGFPNTGELFLARENGINEMVGRIGNRPAVANNDQIVEGVKQGVYEAVIAAMSMMNQQTSDQPIVVETTVEMDGKAIVHQTDKARRRMGYNFQFT